MAPVRHHHRCDAVLAPAHGSVITPALLRAYLDTRYLIHDREHVIEARPGRRTAAVDRLLLRHRVATAAFLTACNPHSRPLRPFANRRACTALARHLDTLGVSFLAGAGVAIRGDWPAEPSVLALGLDRPEAGRIARRFRQNAFVLLARGRPARLVLLH